MYTFTFEHYLDILQILFFNFFCNNQREMMKKHTVLSHEYVHIMYHRYSSNSNNKKYILPIFMPQKYKSSM